MQHWYYGGIVFCLFVAGAFFWHPTIRTKEIGEFKDVNHGGTEEMLVESTLPTTIYFLGDIMMARDVEKKILKFGDDYLFKNISFLPHSYAVGNFESAIPETHVVTPNNTFRFSTAKEFLPLLNKLGVTHVSLANNHAYDFGLAGFNQTLSVLAESNLIAFGHPSVIATTSVTKLKTAKGAVGILAVHTLYAEPNRDALLSQIESMRNETELQIAYVHWGDEYVKNPNQSQINLAEFLVANGVDLIIGHHPHIVQSIGKIGTVPVIYSLGNFVFDQYFSEEVMQGLVVKLEINEGASLELLPVSTKDTPAAPRFLEDTAKSEFLFKLAASSTPLLKEQIEIGLIRL